MTVKVQIKDFSKIYSNGDGVKGINLEIQQNEILTLLGPSGCGKTTILRALGGFIKPTAGQILIDGIDVTHEEPENRPTGMVFQSYNLWPHMTVYENLAFGLKLRKMDKARIKQEITAMLDMMKMPGMEKKYPSQLSGGQQQRIAIARSLLLKPVVLLLDEPFSALDAKIRQQMREELKRLQKELNLTVLFVTHDQEEALSISHRIVVMDKGSIAQVGNPSDIYDNPNSQYVASFIGDMNFIEQDGQVLAVRPESIKLGQPDQYSHQATVLYTMALGHYGIVYLATSSGNEIKAIVARHELDAYSTDLPVSFDILKSHRYQKA